MTEFVQTLPYSMTQEIIWRDMDAFQHVNNAVYFRYFEDVRMAFFEDIGAVEYGKTNQVGPVMAFTRCDFRAPLSFPDRIHIGAHVEDIKSKRFTMKYEVYSEAHDRVAAQGECLLVYYDLAALKSCAIPGFIREQLETLVM